jgi:two-component system OmpR family response regulator
MNRNSDRIARSANVLVVDDDRHVREVLRMRLSQIGCLCTACGNASEAIVQFETGGFGLVITDMAMPAIDGLGMVSMIRNQSDVPIMVLTGHAVEYGPLIAGYKNVTVFHKPFAIQALVASVRALLAGAIDPEARLKFG